MASVNQEPNGHPVQMEAGAATTTSNTKSYNAIEDLEECDHVHYSQRSGWLRAAVLGANDGLVSVASLLMGVAAAGSSKHAVSISGRYTHFPHCLSF
jgi:VIT1/CCC1 family predicted Fe2+/Mn2+ transporter